MTVSAPARNWRRRFAEALAVGCALGCVAPITLARAQSAGSFANKTFDIRFTEVQATEDPARPEIPQNRRTIIRIGEDAAATRIVRNWDKPPPGLETFEAAGPLGKWISLQSRARLRHVVDGPRLTQTIMTSSFVSRMTIELQGAGCKVRFAYFLLPGETYFRMRNIALGTPMRVKAIRVEAAPQCAIAEDLLF
jgi:hypothetical protein